MKNLSCKGVCLIAKTPFPTLIMLATITNHKHQQFDSIKNKAYRANLSE